MIIIIQGIDIDFIEDRGDTVEISFELDIISIDTEAYGKSVDGEDYRTNYWSVFLEYNKDTKKYSKGELFYITNQGPKNSGILLKEDELGEIIKLLKKETDILR